MKMRLLVLLLGLATPVLAADPKGLRVFVSADMEGITAVVNASQLGPGELDYDRFRKLMTADVNAAIDGALAAGAVKITVADAHGNGLSILPDELNPKARLVRSWPRPLEMMEGVDGGFDAAFLVGYHASIGTPVGVRAHTISSRRFYDVRLNGKHASEAMLSAAVAGHFDVPVVLVTGDDVAVAEAKGTIGPWVTAVAVKRAIGYHSAESLSPEAAHAAIKEGAREALSRLASAKPYKIAGRVKLEIAFKAMLNAEVLALLPFVTRVDGSTIAFDAKDVTEVTRFIAFATNYDSNL